MNKRICATAVYHVDSENVTPSHLSFRMQTSPDDTQGGRPGTCLPVAAYRDIQSYAIICGEVGC